MNKMWRWFVYSNSNVRDKKNDWSNIHQYMFYYGCFRFMKYCILLRTYLHTIIAQFRNHTKLCCSCVSIDLWRIRFPWPTFQKLWPRYGDSPYKTSRSLVKYCTHWLSNWSNTEQFLYDLKKISRSFGGRKDSSLWPFSKEIYCITEQ